MFEQAFLDSTTKTCRPLTVTISILGQILLVALTILLPLAHTGAIAPFAFAKVRPAPRILNAIQLVETVKHPSRSGSVRITAISGPLQVFTAPAKVPGRVVTGDEATAIPLLPDSTGAAAVASDYGIQGGTGDSIQMIPKLSPPASTRPKEIAAAAKPRPVPVGGKVQAAKLIKQVIPPYPALAKQARISGIVRLAAVIAQNGTIEQLQVISGHPLLIPAALEAVRQWTYQPTLLNGEPVQIITQIDVNFTLAH